MSVLVVGGGAAGLTSAHFAALQGAHVRVLEKTREPGKKILLSGGTRCNVLPASLDSDRDYFSHSNRNLIQAVFRSWSLDDCLDWITSPDGVGLDLKLEEATHKYFPVSDSARDVRDALVKSCLRHGVQFEHNCSVRSVKQKGGARWECETEDGRLFGSDQIILATGGKSYPKVGTDGVGYSIVKKLGHTLHPPIPALTPLLAPHPGHAQLSGVSLREAQVEAESAATQEKCRSERSDLLFTHRGLSGPSVLDVSHVIASQGSPSDARIFVNWSSDSQEEWETRLRGAKWKGTVPNFVRRFGIPSRLAAALCTEAAIPLDRTLSHLTKGERRALVKELTRFEVVCTGHGGFRLAEVTAGGVPFEEVDVASLESNMAPGIFLCGELMDIFGRIGGFNFYWAWLSGRLAGMSVCLE